MTDQLKSTSKYLSYILRHRPDSIGLQIDGEGWVNIEELIRCSAAHGKTLSPELITQVVATNDKQRFRLSADGRMIRANQGHSIPVDLGLQAVEPLAVLYHGTATRYLASIQEHGLQARGRQHVHLSKDVETAVKVGQRHGRPVVLQVEAGRMHAKGHSFYLSENEVWLVVGVLAGYFTVLEQSTGNS